MKTSLEWQTAKSGVKIGFYSGIKAFGFFNPKKYFKTGKLWGFKGE